MPTRVLLLRHAETANPLIFHGAESDIGLSERGRRQAEALAPLLAAEAPNVVVSSAMQRALETATPIARSCGLPVRIEAELHERRVGALERHADAAARGRVAGHAAALDGRRDGLRAARRRIVRRHTPPRAAGVGARDHGVRRTDHCHRRRTASSARCCCVRCCRGTRSPTGIASGRFIMSPSANCSAKRSSGGQCESTICQRNWLASKPGCADAPAPAAPRQLLCPFP